MNNYVFFSFPVSSLLFSSLLFSSLLFSSLLFSSLLFSSVFLFPPSRCLTPPSYRRSYSVQSWRLSTETISACHNKIQQSPTRHFTIINPRSQWCYCTFRYIINIIYNTTRCLILILLHRWFQHLANNVWLLLFWRSTYWFSGLVSVSSSLSNMRLNWYVPAASWTDSYIER